MGVYRAIARRMNPFLKGLFAKRTEGGAYHILYVNGCTVGESGRYRVYNLIEALTPFAITAHVVFPEELPFQKPKDYALVVFFRCDLNTFTEAFVKKCRADKIPTVFDVDDLIFDDTIVSEIDAYNRMTEENQTLYVEGVRRYRGMLDSCDYATASTEYLRQYIENLTGKKTLLIYNGINNGQIKVAKAAAGVKSLKRRIGFLSGSQTHQKDFAAAAPALAYIMEKYSDVVLTVVGYLDIPSCLKPFENRIETYPFMDYRELLRFCSDLYLVVVPLEYETKFCQAKSELKYFEQALVGVPVIASPTQVFRDAIQNGENGFLAKGDAEWIDKLQKLLNAPELRDAMGKKAYQQVSQVYFPEKIGNQAKAAYDQVLAMALKKSMDRDHLRVSIVIPEPFEGAGGHRNIFRVARAFTQQGHKVTIYIDGPSGRFLRNSSIKKFVTKAFFETNAEFCLDSEQIEPCDLLIATHWHTAYIVQKYRHRCILPCYFIQDFEPYFYPMGEEYVQAYATYSFGFSSIASGKWAAEMVERISGKECPHFVFPLQREIYHEDEKIQREDKTVVFFARPQMPRRCYMLGVEALKLLKQKAPDCRIVFYGADKAEYMDHGFAYEKMGMMSGPRSLAELYNRATVGVCFSLTNPSLVPYEMMACGLPIVDLNFNNSAASYDGMDTALLAEPSPQAVCDAILSLLNHPEEANRRRENGKQLTEQMPNEEQIGKFAVEVLIDDLFSIQINKTDCE